MSPADDTAPALAPIRVAVVTLAPSAATPRVLAELRGAAMQVEVAAGEALLAPPPAPVCVVVVDGAIAAVLADRIAAWAASSELRPGLIGLVEGGALTEALPEVLLAAGFDDAVDARISPRELAGRVRALHRRVHRKVAPNGRLRHGELTLDLHGRALWVAGAAIPLTPIELAVLRELVKARGRPRSRTELLDAAWGAGDLEVSERAVDNAIQRLRRKLPRPDLIETVRGVGFRVAAP